VLKQRHAQAQSVVDHGERNLHSHGQVLSPEEVANRVESRRAGVAHNKSEPDAWKRAENLELASGRHMTPQRLKSLEANAKGPNRVTAAAASAQLESTKRQVTARMQTSERLLEGVPTRNQFNRKVAANAPQVASEELRGAGKKDNLSERARMRQRELKHQRYTRKRLYRG
jgi:phytoene/squalene synthetase